MMEDSSPMSCTYSVGDPFNADDPERRCGKPAVKRAFFPNGWGVIYYCRRHWGIASQVIEPSIEVVDIDGTEDGN